MTRNLSMIFAALALAALCSTQVAAEDKPSAAAPIWEKVPNPPGVTVPRWIDVDKDGTLYLADSYKGFHMTRDNGKTWVDINGSGLPEKMRGGYTIQVDPATGNLVAGVCDPGTNGAYYYISADQGKTWTKMEKYKVGFAPTNDGVCFLPNGDILYGGIWQAATVSGVFLSTDHGKTCEMTKGGGGSGGALCVGYNPVTKDCWMGAEPPSKCVFRSTDMGRSWTHVTTPDKIEGELFGDVIHFAFNKAGDVVIECISCVVRTKDKGATWEKVYNSGTDAGAGGFLRADPNGYLYVGNKIRWRKNPPIARSTKDGDKDTWEDFSAGIPFHYHGMCIVYSPADGRMYTVCKDHSANPQTAQIYRTIEPVAKPGAATKPASVANSAPAS